MGESCCWRFRVVLPSFVFLIVLTTCVNRQLGFSHCVPLSFTLPRPFTMILDHPLYVHTFSNYHHTYIGIPGASEEVSGSWHCRPKSGQGHLLSNPGDSQPSWAISLPFEGQSWALGCESEDWWHICEHGWCSYQEREREKERERERERERVRVSVCVWEWVKEKWKEEGNCNNFISLWLDRLLAGCWCTCFYCHVCYVCLQRSHLLAECSMFSPWDFKWVFVLPRCPPHPNVGGSAQVTVLPLINADDFIQHLQAFQWLGRIGGRGNIQWQSCNC